MIDLSAINRKLLFLVSNPFSALGAFGVTSQNQSRRLNYPFDESALKKVFFGIFGSEGLEAKKFIQAALQVYNSEVSHENSTDTFVELITASKKNDLNLISLFELETVCQAIGLFSASIVVKKLIVEKITNLNVHKPTWNSRYQKVLCEIDQGNLAEAAAALNILKKSFRSSEPFRQGVISELDMYMYFWSNGQIGDVSEQQDLSGFDKFISNSNVRILGPSVGSELKVEPNFVTARVMKPNVIQWEDRLSEGSKSEIVYCSGETTRWLETLSETDFLQNFSYVSIRPKSFLTKTIANARQVSTVNHLLLRGAPNMLTYMLFDIIRCKPSSILISHFDFYTQDIAYRDGSRKSLDIGLPSERSISSLGSDGRRFNRCVTLALHGMTYNRNLIKNLVSSQIIKTRQEVESALKLNEEEYCQVLDDIYGVNQI